MTERGDAFERDGSLVKGNDKARQQVREGFDRYYGAEKPAIPPSSTAPYTFQQVKDWRFNGTPLPKREREIEKVISYLKEQVEDVAIDHEAQNKLDAALYPDLPLIDLIPTENTQSYHFENCRLASLLHQASKGLHCTGGRRSSGEDGARALRTDIQVS